MTCTLTELVALAEAEMSSTTIKDYCPNGLQVQGRQEVKKIVGGVTASQALIDAAIERKADVLLVHHGFFWKGENPCIVGIKQKRLKALLKNDISLLAYHLPLDVHSRLGNNYGLGQALGIQFEGYADQNDHPPLVSVGSLSKAMTPEALQILIASKLGREPMLIKASELHEMEEKVAGLIKRVAWCTGAAQGYIDKAADAGVDAYISGEISEPTVHTARERGIHYFSAGHHATETFGVKALGSFLANKLNVDFEFIDIPNPV